MTSGFFFMSFLHEPCPYYKIVALIQRITESFTYNICNVWVSSFLWSARQTTDNSRNNLGSRHMSYSFPTNLLDSTSLRVQGLLEAGLFQ